MTPELEAAYSEPHRRYHTLAHVQACLDLLARRADLDAAERRLLSWAIWFHDAIYDPRASDNEARSAELALAQTPALGASPDDAAEVARLVRLTAGHEVAEGDRLGAVLVGIDLAILGAAGSAYDAYARAVREEYGFVPEEAWRRGRAAVLQRFLAAPVIYADPELRMEREAQARANLVRELSSLR
ncbi:MAG: phosphohydrolase [Alphaproteobacteria bacterium]|nr:phosphohydrolase [Alphaproteobacteria bacterium]